MTGDHTGKGAAPARDRESYRPDAGEHAAARAADLRRKLVSWLQTNATLPDAESAYASLTELATELFGTTRERVASGASDGVSSDVRAWMLLDALLTATTADVVAHAQADREPTVDAGQSVREQAELQRELAALHAAAVAIRKSEDDVRRLFDACPVPLLLLRRADERVLMANEVAASSLATEPDALVEQPVRTLFVHRSDLLDALGALVHGGRGEAREVQLRSHDGQSFWALLSARSVVYGEVPAVMIGFTDLTAQKAVEHQLRVLAQHDPLTQAYNRHHFWQLASTEMARVTRYRRPLSLAMIDADRFKSVNDRYGHDVGDLVLRSIVDICRDSLRTNDVLARYGGEELVVLLPETPVDGALAVVERLRERIAQTPIVLEDGRTIAATVSIGLAGIHDHKEGLEQLLKRADEALYAAKRHGRNRVEVAPLD